MSKLAKGPLEFPIVGSFFELRKNPPYFFTQLAHEYGSVAAFTVFGRKAYLLSDPELIKEVLVNQPKNFRKSRGLQLAKALLGDGLLTSEGNLHKTQRKLAAPAFAKNRLQTYGEEMIRLAYEHAEKISAGSQIDFNDRMMKLTLAIVNKTLFNADVSDDADEVALALEIVLNNMDRILNPFTEILNKLPVPSTLRLQKAQNILDRIIYRIIAERRATPGDRGDLLSIFLSAQNDEQGRAAAMSDKQIRDECITLFIAGHETTANALSWIFYLLAKHPTILQAAQDEIQVVTQGQPLTVNDLSKLTLISNIFYEALRLYPPAWTISREALVDVTLGDYQISAGSTVVMSQWVMHRHQQYWETPEIFDPARFNAESDRPKFAYFPFGGGVRQCIGDQFAWTEGVLLTAVFLQKFTPALISPNYTAEINPMITLRPKDGLPLIMKSSGN